MLKLLASATAHETFRVIGHQDLPLRPNMRTEDHGVPKLTALAIGQGLAGALGVQIAKPDRPVICVSGDGSAMYSIQALWTAAHMGLPIVFVILANREYRVLKHNIDVYRQRFGIASQEPYAHMDLATPHLGFVEMAAGMGVAGTRIADPDAVAPAIRAAFATGRPHLVEVLIEGKR